MKLFIRSQVYILHGLYIEGCGALLKDKAGSTYTVSFEEVGYVRIDHLVCYFLVLFV